MYCPEWVCTVSNGSAVVSSGSLPVSNGPVLSVMGLYCPGSGVLHEKNLSQVGR